jgi:glycosyltransferase involved in cell wall biosynthesis
MVKGSPLEPEWGHLASQKGPFVFWDAFGLEGISGVARHGASIRKELALIGVDPILLPHGNFGARWATRLNSTKILWTRNIGRIMEKANYLHGRSVVHGLSNFNIPRSKSFHKAYKSVLTVHDLIPLIAPREVSRASGLQLRYCLKRLEPSLDLVICVSKWTEDQLLEFFPSFKGRTEVIPNGFRPFRPMRRVGNTCHTSILSVGRFEKYKNFEILFNVLRHGAGKVRLKLVTDFKGGSFVRQKAKDLLGLGWLEVLLNVDESALKYLYESSQVYLQPSSLEGFCLPLAEAISFGVPCVYVQGSAMDEVAGSAISIPLKTTALPSDWLGAIEIASSWNYDSHYLCKVSKHLAKRPSWKDVAASLSGVYAKLL